MPSLGFSIQANRLQLIKMKLCSADSRSSITEELCHVSENQKPILHRSICTGETTAGFKDPGTGKYTEMMLIRNEKDLKQFMKEYGITERPETEY